MEGVVSRDAAGGVRHEDGGDGVGVTLHQSVPASHLHKASTRGDKILRHASSIEMLGERHHVRRRVGLTEDHEGERSCQHDDGLSGVCVDDGSQTT